jgi:uncharacterized protein (DUF1800 family)
VRLRYLFAYMALFFPSIGLVSEAIDQRSTKDDLTSNKKTSDFSMPNTSIYASGSSVSLHAENFDAAIIQSSNGASGGEFLDSLSFDVDGDGEYDALTDGLLLLRGMFGLTGDSLIAGAIAPNAAYTSSTVIAARIDRLSALLDIDGNGQVDALTDGLVILRYLFGLRGDALVSGVIASDATVTAAADIGAKIRSRVTPNSVPVAKIALSSEAFIAGTDASFTGGGSSDEEDDTLSYSWSLQKPDFSLAELDKTNSEAATFRPDAIGEYTLTLSVSDTNFGTTSITKSFTPSLPSPEPLPAYAASSPPVGVITDDVDAVRFLTQATFGPTVESVKELLTKGGETWFNEQVNLPFSSWGELRRTSWIEEIDPIDSRDNGKSWLETLFSETAQSSPDQLRHRVAFILSQLFVISAHTEGSHNELGIIDYWDGLGRNAFGNFRDLLENVTLHPTMGHYLGMLGNQKADPENNIRPDENFAREVMQLFTIGLRELNQDGSVKLNPSGDAIETYDQETITQYAAALTGWYYDTTESNHDENFACSNTCFPMELAKKPMVAFDHIHQKTEKRLLRGYYIPPGQSAEQDLQITLDSLFNHPNLAPFFSLHLIRQMVTSNPSPEFVGRVSAVFNNNGEGVRGDIGATVKAVLFDAEARRPDTAEVALYGKVKEPLMFITHLNRLFNITMLSPETVSAENLYGPHKWLRTMTKPSQEALYAESVFNFFRPDFAPNGEIATMGLVAPELQITTEASVVNDLRLFHYGTTTKEIWEVRIANGADPNSFVVAYDFSHIDKIWESEGYPAVIDHLNLYMTGNSMDSEYKSNLMSFSRDPDYAHVFDGKVAWWNENYTDRMLRNLFLFELIYLIITTPEFRVQK